MIKTHYTFRRAAGSVEEYADLLQEMHIPYFPITDLENTFSWKKVSDICAERNMKPIFGVTLRLAPKHAERKPRVSEFKFYAVNSVKPLNDMIALAYKNSRSLPRLGMTPLLHYEDLKQFPDVVKVAGFNARLDNLDPETPNLFVGLSPACAKGFINDAKSRGFKFYATQEAVFPHKEDSQFYEISCGWQADIQTYPQWLIDDETWENFLLDKGIEQNLIEYALSNRDELWELSEAKLERGDLIKINSEKTLRQMCEEGAVARGIDLNDPVYQERLDTELEVIEDKEFESYFFLVSDMLNFAKTRGIVGPGRGSSAGSLVAYLLGITSVDPVKYGLLFFRFLDVSRGGWKIKKDWSGF